MEMAAVASATRAQAKTRGHIVSGKNGTDLILIPICGSISYYFL